MVDGFVTIAGWLIGYVAGDRFDVACGDLRVVVPGVDVGIPCDDDCTFPGFCLWDKKRSILSIHNSL